MADDFNQPEGAPAPAAESVSLETLNSKLDQLLSIMQPAQPAVDIVETAKAEGAPEGTESASGGEGAEKKLPEDIVEETQEDQPGATAPEKVKLEKSVELAELKKSMEEIKKSVETITKSTIGRPVMTAPKKTEESEDLALEVAKGQKKVNWEELNDSAFESERDNVLKALGRKA